MSIIEKARKLRKTIESLSINLDDTDALDNVELFPAWDGESKSYEADCRVRYDEKLYRCLQTHTSQETWNPADSPSLWALILIPDPEVIPEWVQPDSTNPYMTGDKVMHNGKVWRSLVDNNVWEPGAVGTEALWEEVM